MIGQAIDDISAVAVSNITAIATTATAAIIPTIAGLLILQGFVDANELVCITGLLFPLII
jgi:hypothetical protein